MNKFFLKNILNFILVVPKKFDKHSKDISLSYSSNILLNCDRLSPNKNFLEFFDFRKFVFKDFQNKKKKKRNKIVKFFYKRNKNLEHYPL